jgi:hypothetical protein
MNPQEDRLFFFFGGVAAAMSSLRVTSQQPCHADSGLCHGGHLWLRHTGIRPSQYENPKLHIGVGWGRPFGTWLDALSSSASRRRRWG